MIGGNMNTKGYSVGTYIVKSEKKKSELPMCPTCKKCKDKSICKNRKNKKEMSRCEKCKKCTMAESCDKFYINVQHKATLTIGKDISTGKPIKKSFTGSSQDEALEQLFQYKIDMKKNGTPLELQKTEKTISIIAQEIEDSKYRIGKIRGNTYVTNMATLERIKTNKFAHIPIAKVTKQQIENFLENERKKSNSTLKKDYRMLKKVFDYASYNLNIPTNFFEGINAIELPKSLKEDKDVTALTITEQRLLEEYLQNHNVRHKNIVLLCLYTGIRVGETLALDYTQDIDLDNNMLKITKTLTKDKSKKLTIGPTKNKNGKRNLEINELTESILEDALSKVIKNPNNVLFCQENKRLFTDNTINSAFKRIFKNAGITKPVNTHILRHTFATRCIEAGISLPVLQKLMGHANIQTTINTYGDIYNYYQNKETQKYIDYIKSEETKNK